MKLYSYPEVWTLLDNSGTALDVIAFEKFASLRKVDQEICDGLVARYGKP